MKSHLFASQRTRKIWLAVLASTLGTALMTVLVVWVEAARNTDLADASAGITNITQEFDDRASPDLRFRDVAGEMGIVMQHGPGPRGRQLPEDTGSGLAWGDYDGDGDWDLYIVNFAGPLGQSPHPGGTNRLYRNDGDRFTDVTVAAAVADLDGFGMGATFADFDDDGDQDLYVTNFGANRLYRNRGDGTFDEIAGVAGVADASWSTGAAWGDFDRDGFLDLYVCNYVDYDVGDMAAQCTALSPAGQYSIPFTLNPNSFDPAPNRLYRSRGDGTFEEVADECWVSDPSGRSFSASFCDLDGDGWLDLYVTNDVSENKLFRNLQGDDQAIGDGVAAPAGFVDISAETGTADPRGSMGLSVGEFGPLMGLDDALPDLFFTNWLAQENALLQSVHTRWGTHEYRDKAREVRLGEVSLDMVGWGCGIADLDLDGRPDLLVANGNTLECPEDPLRLITQPLLVFWNDGRHFRNVASRIGGAVARPHAARGLAIADFDGDGDSDFAVNVNRGQPLLVRNDTHLGNESLRIRLRGASAACFGAKVEVLSDRHRQVQWWRADASYLSGHAPELVFGLGRAGAASQISVTWADGTASVLQQVATGMLTITHTGTSIPVTASARAE